MKTKLFFITLLLFFVLNGCDKNNGTTATSDVAEISHVTQSECKDRDEGTKLRTTETVREMLLLKATDQTHLQVVHQNVIFNCCPGTLSAVCQVQGAMISVVEQESEQGCKCLCPYDLGYTISPLKFGKYTMNIKGYKPVYFTFSEDLDISVELVKIDE